MVYTGLIYKFEQLHKKIVIFFKFIFIKIRMKIQSFNVNIVIFFLTMGGGGGIPLVRIVRFLPSIVLLSHDSRQGFSILSVRNVMMLPPSAMQILAPQAIFFSPCKKCQKYTFWKNKKPQGPMKGPPGASGPAGPGQLAPPRPQQLRHWSRWIK